MLGVGVLLSVLTLADRALARRTRTDAGLVTGAPRASGPDQR